MQKRPQLNPRRRVLKRDFARELRATATDAERKLWSRLRSKQMAHLRFRRQPAIGPFVPDFYCSAAKLIVELDGGKHGQDKNLAYDEHRTRWFKQQRYRVLRFPNHEVLRNMETVLEAIWRAVRESGCPLPEPPSAVRPSLEGRAD